MGNASARNRTKRPTEEKSVSGLLSLAELQSQTPPDIENLVFADCGSESSSYAGAVRVLENLCILPKIKRFSGVGSGAVVAALLAIRLDSNELQASFNEYLNNVQIGYENSSENFFEEYTEKYGWVSGKKIFKWFGTVLECKYMESDLSFLQLFKKTGKELCIVVTNVDKETIEYCHPKTTPDLPIRQAVYMAVSVPGIFIPAQYGQANDNCLYVNGTLMCTYPIHCFDGWLLSMKEEDSLLNKLDFPEKFYQPEVFDGKNAKTLGFFRFDKKQETHYKEFVNRLASANADLKIPRTTLGLKYKSACQSRSNVVNNFTLLRKACSTLLLMSEDFEDDLGQVFVIPFAKKVFTDKSFTKADRLLFPEIGNTLRELQDFLLTLSDNECSFSRFRLKLFTQTKLISLLNQYADYYKNDITDLHSYFAAVFDIDLGLDKISTSDYDRTVGIVCRHVSPNEVDFEDDDQNFLYRQGWNATVCYLRNLTQNDNDEC